MRINVKLIRIEGEGLNQHPVSLQRIEDFKPIHSILCGSDEVFPNSRLFSLVAFVRDNVLEVTYLQDGAA
jgi:hypothetical protein